ncbi:MAG: hypothetical protein KJ626_03335, partial [Verrucomicrobia bacterium]|nr:hypothetical protein [Verrucomicrobiota bacterium]
INLTEGAVLNPPIVEITDPAVSPLDVLNAVSSYDVKGMASTGTVGQLTWTNSATGASGSIAAATNWTVSGMALNVGANLITVLGTNATGSWSSDAVTIRRGAPASYSGTMIARINEVEFNGPGTDSNDFIEIIAPAGTNLLGCFIVHFNGDEAGDHGVWRLDLPDFVVPDDGVTDVNGTHLGFFVMSYPLDPVPNVDADGGELQSGPDGIVLYDAFTNIVDAVAWEGPGDLPTDDPGTVIAAGDTEADNFLSVTPDDTAGTTSSVQAPNNVLGDDGSGWQLLERTPGVLNGNQTNGSIIIVSGGMPPGDTDHDGISDDYETKYSGTATGLVAGADIDGDGKINIDEYIADTVPTNGLSFFENLITNTVESGATIVLIAGPPTTNSRVYDAWFSTDLVNDGWTALGLDVPGAPNGGIVTLIVTNDAGRKIYRTGVKIQ